MRRLPALAMTALVILFLAEGQRALFASMFGLVYDALFPRLRVDRALLALLPLLALLAPLVPLARWTDRAGAVAIAAAATALFRLPMTWPALETRLIGGALVLAAGATFLTWAVGRVERGALAGGVVLGLVLDQMLRLAGTSYDVSLQPGWLPVQGLLSLALIGIVLFWSRAATVEDADRGSEGLERRAGGLRLRGGLALGALLFMDLHVVGLPSAVARWAVVSHTFAAAVVTAASALGLLATLALGRPSRGRITALAMAGLLVAGPLLALAGEGRLVALVMAAAHLAALLLVTRALDPASGRRSGRTVTAGLSVLVLTTALYSITFFPSFSLPWMAGAAPWIFAAAGLLLAGSFVLLPRPAELEPLPAVTAAGAAAVIAAIGALLLVFLPGRTPTPGDRARSGTELRVATWNGHYGFDERWRFDPGALAATLAETDADVVALQEMVAGAPFAYGIDLPLWLGHQLGVADYFAPTVNGLLGDAFLSALPTTAVMSLPLPAAGGERKQMLALTAPVGDTEVRFHALHLALEPDARHRQIQTALAAVPDGPAVILGDLNAGPTTTVAHQLKQAGFHDVFEGAAAPPPTSPARAPTERIDWIWTRGFDVTSATVPEPLGSDHRPVVAVLRVPAQSPHERASPGGR